MKLVGFLPRDIQHFRSEVNASYRMSKLRKQKSQKPCAATNIEYGKRSWPRQPAKNFGPRFMLITGMESVVRIVVKIRGAVVPVVLDRAADFNILRFQRRLSRV